jgi:CheY-like chemotaxis protein
MLQRVILIEDDPLATKLTGDILARVAPEVRLEVARDGHSALARLHRYTENGRETIALIILDLRIPHLHGIDLLKHIKGRPETRSIPVVVVSGTATVEQTQELYNLGANSYILKQADPVENSRNLETVLNYWIRINVLPTMVHRTGAMQ